MGLFDDPNEAFRKKNLKNMEDKRLRFAEKCAQEGFAPKSMLLFSTEHGGLTGLCRDNGKICLIIGPDFGGEGEFILERYDKLTARREEFFEAAEGMGGVLGFGKKGATGFNLIITRSNGEERSIPVIVNRGSIMECKAKNPLLSTKRRRHDANVVWDMRPILKDMMKKLEATIDEYTK